MDFTPVNIRDIKPGMKSLNVLFIVLEIGKYPFKWSNSCIFHKCIRYLNDLLYI